MIYDVFYMFNDDEIGARPFDPVPNKNKAKAITAEMALASAQEYAYELAKTYARRATRDDQWFVKIMNSDIVVWQDGSGHRLRKGTPKETK